MSTGVLLHGRRASAAPSAARGAGGEGPAADEAGRPAKKRRAVLEDARAIAKFQKVERLAHGAFSAEP